MNKLNKKILKLIKLYNLNCSIEDFESKADWVRISSYRQSFSEPFIEKYQDKLNWSSISLFQDLSWDFIQKFSQKIILKNLSNNDCLNENLINLIKENDELFNDELIL